MLYLCLTSRYLLKIKAKKTKKIENTVEPPLCGYLTSIKRAGIKARNNRNQEWGIKPLLSGCRPLLLSNESFPIVVTSKALDTLTLALF